MGRVLWRLTIMLSMVLMPGCAGCGGAPVPDARKPDDQNAIKNDDPKGPPVANQRIEPIDPNDIVDLRDSRVDDQHLAKIVRMPGIVGLNLEGASNITDAGLSHLAAAPELRWLNIGGLNISAKGLSHLRQAPKLHSLYLGGMLVDDARLAALTQLQQVRLLSIPYMGEASLRTLAEKMPNLESLDLTSQAKADDELKPLREFRKLRHLWLPHRAGDAALRTVQHLDTLQELRLEFTGTVTSEGVRRIGTLRELRLLCLPALSKDTRLEPPGTLVKLVTLELSTATLDDNIFSTLPALPELVNLNLRGTSLSAGGLQLLRRLPKLRSLDLSASPMTADYFKEISELGGLHELRLDQAALREHLLPDHVMKQIGKLKNLRKLDLRYHPISGEGLKEIKDLVQLESLLLHETLVKGKDLNHLSAMKNLRVLHLGRCSVSDEDLVFLKNHPELADLSLYQASITDKGIPHIAKLHHLRWLDLNYTFVSDDGLMQLTHLKNLRSLGALQMLTIWRDLTAFRKACPDCRVTSRLTKDLVPISDIPWKFMP